MNAPRVGGDVDAYCTRCKMILAHTVLAMVGERIAKVRCNTCHGEHAFKPGLPGSSSARTARPRARSTSTTATRSTRSRVDTRSFDDLLAGRELGSATRYTPRGSFSPGELIHHPTFGLGVVQVERGDKIDVAFRAGAKTLIHGQGKPPVAAED